VKSLVDTLIKYFTQLESYVCTYHCRMDLIILCIELCVLNYGTMYLSNYVLNIAIELCVEL
jgi:hypothetical protein